MGVAADKAYTFFNAHIPECIACLINAGSLRARLIPIFGAVDGRSFRSVTTIIWVREGGGDGGQVACPSTTSSSTAYCQFSFYLRSGQRFLRFVLSPFMLLNKKGVVHFFLLYKMSRNKKKSEMNILGNYCVDGAAITATTIVVVPAPGKGLTLH